MADPGFPIGGVLLLGGHGPPTQVLFGENVCKNERIGSHRRWRAPGTAPPLDPPMDSVSKSSTSEGVPTSTTKADIVKAKMPTIVLEIKS